MIPAGVQVYVALEPVNMRYSFERLSGSPATEWIAVTSIASSNVIGGMIVGRRRASIVLPKPMTSDPPSREWRFQRTVSLPTGIIDVSAWAAGENRARRHECACGCGKPIEVLPQHHWLGVPSYRRGHHPRCVSQESRQVRAQGLLTSPEVARKLGIGLSTLARLDGELLPAVTRHGKRRLRVFTPAQVDELRRCLAKTKVTSGLLRLGDVARLAGCCAQVIRQRLGKELRVGRQVSYPRKTWVFTRREATQIAAWVKRHVATKPRKRR